MTNKEATQYLEKMISDRFFDGNHLAHSAFRLALSAIHEQAERENPKPLTLDELWGMGSQPVWIVEYPDWGHWELSADAADYLCDRDPDFYGMKHDDPAGKHGLHALGWLAYRRPPDERSKDNGKP